MLVLWDVRLQTLDFSLPNTSKLALTPVLNCCNQRQTCPESVWGIFFFWGGGFLDHFKAEFPMSGIKRWKWISSPDEFGGRADAHCTMKLKKCSSIGMNYHSHYQWWANAKSDIKSLSFTNAKLCLKYRRDSRVGYSNWNAIRLTFKSQQFYKLVYIIRYHII